MKIPPFELERYFAKHEFRAPYLLCASDCQSYTLSEILNLEPGAHESLQNLWLGYTESCGHPDLREEIANLYETAKAEHILVHSGAEEAIFNFMNSVLEPGDHIIVHFPAYQSLFEVARSIGCNVTLWHGIEKNDWELDIDVLQKHLRPNTKALIMNCPHNPTGYLMPKDKFSALVRLSQKNGFLMFSDEVYRLLEYAEKDRLPALIDVDDRGVSLGVMSKSLGLAGLRIGWIATGNRNLYTRLAAFKDYTTICNSAPSELIATIALRHRTQLIHRNLRIIHDNLSLLNDFFTRYEDRFNWSMPKAGPTAFPSLRLNTDAKTFCRDLVAQTGVLLLPGSLYGDFNKNFRIGFGRADFAEGLLRLDEYLQKIQ